ncbi:metal-dependent hydrolase [Penicillium sp. IBT 35674x]|nr:metal-dependent hydrolase [Penicillium sp. IBT 35674x]
MALGGALSLLKFFASGFFDHFPKSKIVIGHTGEMIPFQLERVITLSETWGLKRGFRELLTQNIWVTTSGIFAIVPLACLLRTNDISRILYSVGYPFSSNEKGLAFFEEVRSSGLLSEDDLLKFPYRNAEELLGVKADRGLSNTPLMSQLVRPKISLAGCLAVIMGKEEQRMKT